MPETVYPLLRRCEIKGAYFKKKEEPDLAEFIAAIPPGEPCEVRPALDNAYDEYCAEVFVGDRWVGFVPKEFSAVIHFLAHVQVDTRAEVVSHAKNGNPEIVLVAIWDDDDE